MSNQQSQIPLPPMIVAGSVWFAPQAILAIDFSQYAVGAIVREIDVLMVGPHELTLSGDDADAFKSWWDQLTGQNRVQPAPVGIRLT